MKEVLTSFQSAWNQFDNRPIYEWASDNVNLHSAYSIPGRFDVNRSKFLISPFNSLIDLRIRQVNIMASPRCFKTGLGELFLLHTIANNAGTFLWIQSSDEMIDKMSDLRMMPLVRSCKPVKEMIDHTDRFAVTKRLFKFPHMQVILTSAKIRALQSIGYKFIVFDEVWLSSEKNFIQEAKARMGDFQSTSKFLLLSQGGISSDSWNGEFESFPIWEWGFKCANCGAEQVLEFNKKREDGTYAGIIWDKNDTTCKGGVWNYQEAAKTCRYECINPQCKHQYRDEPQTRRYMNDHGLYICTKKDGNPKGISYRWNALANIEIPFADLCIEYLQAKDTLSLEGNKLRLQEFYQKRLARPFNVSIQAALSKIILEDYDPIETWGDYTFMSIDCQNNLTEFYYVIRSWNKDGESRLRKWGRVASFEELRKIQAEFKVRDQCVLIDSGNSATQVYAKCVEYGHAGMVGGKKLWLSWIALKGYDAVDFAHPDNTRKIYSTEARGDPNLGKAAQGRTCPLFRWSNYSYKNILSHLRDGKGVKWSCPEFDPEYERQMNSEVLQRTIDKKTNKEKWLWVQKTGIPNHFWDCELMQLVGASMVGLIGRLSNKI